MTEPPTWAGRTATEGQPAGPRKSSDKSALPVGPIIGVTGLVLLVGLGGYLIGQSDSDSALEAVTSTTAEVAGEQVVRTDNEVEPTVDDTQDDTATGDATDDSSADDTVDAADDQTTDGDDAEASSADEETANDETADQNIDAAAAEDVGDRRAVLSAGKLYLRGPIQSEAIANAIIERAAAVVGPDNVVNEYVIDPDEPFPESAPLYVEDLVLFEYGSEDINPAFIPLLDLGTLLMSQNPQVIVTVVSHTDADGSEEFNLALSQLRGEAVKKYWTDLGINPDQIIIDARGESSPIADNNTPDGAQLNRRAEFIITNLLG